MNASFTNPSPCPFPKKNREGENFSLYLCIITRGKGRGAWIAFGFVLAKRDTYAIALHDADVLTYERKMLARLIFPVVHPGCDFEFSKGYYSRISTKMHGRVTRLMYFPLVHAISHIIGKDEYIRYLKRS